MICTLGQVSGDRAKVWRVQVILGRYMVFEVEWCSKGVLLWQFLFSPSIYLRVKPFSFLYFRFLGFDHFTNISRLHWHIFCLRNTVEEISKEFIMCPNSQNHQVIDNCLINKICVSQHDWGKVMSLAGQWILTISCLKGIQTFPAGKKVSSGIRGFFAFGQWYLTLIHQLKKISGKNSFWRVDTS